jgi:hypothetical protein
MPAKGYRALCCGILYCALEDIEDSGLITSVNDRELAMAFVHSEYCQFICDFVDLPYDKILKRAISLYEKYGVENDCLKTR